MPGSSHSDSADASLRDAWEGEASRWIRWAREPGHDSYWRFHRDRFLELLPPPGRLTLDVGCGEGRLPRDLQTLGHRVIGVDTSPTLVRAAAEADPAGEYLVADAAALPFEDGFADLVIAFMSLMDMDDMDGAVREAVRVLEPGGRFCIAVVHPLNSGGRFASDEPGAPFVLEGDYFQLPRYAETVERDGLQVTFTSIHRTLEAYFAPLEQAGLLVERVREVAGTRGNWPRMPLFLHIRALKPV